MSESYPMLVLPGYEMYQLAHIATFVADGLRGARTARADRDPQARDAAEERVAAGRVALTAVGYRGADASCPRPIDTATLREATGLLATGDRRADVVSLAALGRPTWAVVGRVPGIGAVGAEVGEKAVADALRHHFLTQPAAELTAWCVTGRPHRIRSRPPHDLAALVEGLDPARDRDRAVARGLRGTDHRTDTAIRRRFAGVDLDAPLVVTPPTAASSPQAQVPARNNPSDSPRPVRTPPAPLPDTGR